MARFFLFLFSNVGNLENHTFKTTGLWSLWSPTFASKSTGGQLFIDKKTYIAKTSVFPVSRKDQIRYIQGTCNTVTISKAAINLLLGEYISCFSYSPKHNGLVRFNP